VRAERGYLAVDEAHTTLTATGFRQDQQEIRRTLVRDVNAALIRIGRLCNQALQLDPEAPCPEDTRPIRRLTTADWHSLRKAWETWSNLDSVHRPALDNVFSDTPYIIRLGTILPSLTALSFDASVDTVNSGEGSLLFSLLPAVREWSFGGPGTENQDTVLVDHADLGPPLAGEARLRAILRPFTGGLWRRAVMEQALQRAYPEDRVLR